MFDMKAFTDNYASVGDMQDWAASVMSSRQPDFVIGDDYMRRWYILPRNEQQNVYLHFLRKSDDDVMHDHPWASTSFIIAGGFIEHTPAGSFRRLPGDIIHRQAEEPHWLELDPGHHSVSLFFTGPKIRDWGFHCPKGWVSWQEYTGGKRDGRSVKEGGCGEYA